MKIVTKYISVPTKGFTDIIDISREVQQCVDGSEMDEGSANIFVIGSTAAVTTVELEPGLVKKDIPSLYERLAPYKMDYAHHNTWGDDNGAAHLRTSLTGSSLLVPFVDGELILGTWQQIVLVDFDTSPRKRKIVVQLMGI